MNLDQVIEAIEGQMITSIPYAHIDLEFGFGADLMSDVLVFVAKTKTIMITGLTNPQVIRTAEMADIPAIILVRGKYPPDGTIELAEKVRIPLIVSPYTMYETCGILYAAGLKGIGRLPITRQR
ncbi:MAG: transcriptional regulator [Anaerolineae bacterium]|nr:transcriptional regulator [Anaerolineae bacterium]